MIRKLWTKLTAPFRPSPKFEMPPAWIDEPPFAPFGATPPTIGIDTAKENPHIYVEKVDSEEKKVTLSTTPPSIHPDELTEKDLFPMTAQTQRLDNIYNDAEQIAVLNSSIRAEVQQIKANTSPAPDSLPQLHTNGVDTPEMVRSVWPLYNVAYAPMITATIIDPDNTATWTEGRRTLAELHKLITPDFHGITMVDLEGEWSKTLGKKKQTSVELHKLYDALRTEFPFTRFGHYFGADYWGDEETVRGRTAMINRSLPPGIIRLKSNYDFYGRHKTQADITKAREDQLLEQDRERFGWSLSELLRSTHEVIPVEWGRFHPSGGSPQGYYMRGDREMLDLATHLYSIVENGHRVTESFVWTITSFMFAYALHRQDDRWFRTDDEAMNWRGVLANEIKAWGYEGTLEEFAADRYAQEKFLKDDLTQDYAIYSKALIANR